MTTEFLLDEYFNKYPDSITGFVNFPESKKDEAMVEMEKVLAGKRGPLTDKEFNQAIPEGAES